MWRAVLLGLILLTGCSSSSHEKDVNSSTTVVEHEAHEHHAHGSNQSSNGVESESLGQEMLEDVESGFISGFFQLLFDLIFHRDDD